MEGLSCSGCGRSYPVSPDRWRCDCGFPLDLLFEPRFPIRAILKRPSTFWRYREAIPIHADENLLTLGEGITPLEPVEFNGRAAFLKIDYLFPTGSYKDRGAAILISKLRELGVRKVVEDSSGNAGAAVAAYCARAGIGCEIYVPGSTSRGKLVQIRTYGAVLKRIEGSREKTANAAMKAARRICYASHCWSPFFFHGTKTFAFEIWEQLGWKAPDAVVVPVGHGTLFLGTYLGFKELKDAAKVKRIPRLIGIQSASCAPLYRAYRKGGTAAAPIEKRDTVAEGIAIAEPVRGNQVLKAVKEADGEILTVTEKEIGWALRKMSRRGYFVEPTSAATVAGLEKYLKKSPRSEIVVSTLTGSGLKSMKK